MLLINLSSAVIKITVVTNQKNIFLQKIGFFMLDPHLLHLAPLTSAPHDKQEYFSSVRPEKNPLPTLSSLNPNDFSALNCLDLM